MTPCCHKVCEQLKNQKEYHITLTIITELLSPLVVFIVGLVVFKTIFANIFKTEQLQTAFSFLASVVLSYLVVVFIKKISKSIKKTK